MTFPSNCTSRGFANRHSASCSTARLPLSIVQITSSANASMAMSLSKVVMAVVTLSMVHTVCTADKFKYIQNDQIKLGIDLSRGGAIGYLSAVVNGGNVINNADNGRLVQLSYYGGPKVLRVAAALIARESRSSRHSCASRTTVARGAARSGAGTQLVAAMRM